MWKSNKSFMLLAIACALMMCVPLMVNANEMILNATSTSTSTASNHAMGDILPMPSDQATAASIAMPCTNEAAPTNNFGALRTYISLNAGSSSHPQRLGVAARTRSGIG